jgi:cell pole-organizing protein PopZ
MNRTDGSGEPSMEEILASIRQIIAEDPKTDRASVDAPSPNPLVPRTYAAGANGAAAAEARAPLSDRLKAGSLPPTSPFGSKRPSAIDPDLEDLLDDPVAETRDETPMAPVLKPTADVGTPSPAEPGSVAAAPEATAPVEFPQLSVTAALTPPLPFGASDGSAPAQRTPTFPPLRKPGFYPPAGTTAQPTPKPRPGPSPEERLRSLSAFGSIVPSEIGVGSARTASEPEAKLNGNALHTPEPTPPKTPPVFAGAANGSSSDDLAAAIAGLSKTITPTEPLTPMVEPAVAAATAMAPFTMAPASPFAMPSFAAPAEPALAEPAPVARAPLAPVTAASPVSAAQPLAPEPPIAAAPAASMAQQINLAPPVAPSPTFAAAEPKQIEVEAATVAAQALDALALGLAASAASQAASFPLSSPVVEPRAVPVANGTLEPVRQPVRTLEDAVAEMLRPMLQQWVTDNMPRIIEKALRVEMAKSMKPGSKPTGR